MWRTGKPQARRTPKEPAIPAAMPPGTTIESAVDACVTTNACTNERPGTATIRGGVAGHPEPPVGAPVDRHRHTRLEQLQRLGRPARIEVPGAEPRAPAPDGQQGDVQAGSELAHRAEHLRVPGEVHPGRASDQVA